MSLQDILQENITIQELRARLLQRQREIDRRRGMTKAEQAKAIYRLFPELAEETVKTAAYGMAGKVKLPGTGGIFQTTLSGGKYPAWLDNKYHTNEYLWQLNRMDWWQTLLAAYALTGEAAYGRRVVEELVDWIRTVKRPALNPADMAAMSRDFHSLSPWRTLEIGIRLHKSWPLIMEHLLGSEILSDAALEKFILSVQEQAEVLAELSPHFFPKADHNHYVMENLGLLWVSSYFPEFKQAEKWRKQAEAELERCIRVQMTDDGAHIEGCPMYHNGCIRWFTLAILIARDFGRDFSKEYKRRLEKGLEYSMYSFRPTGEVVPWGDSKANQTAVMAGFYGYLAFDRSDCLNLLSRYTSRDAFWKELQTHIWFLYDFERFQEALQGNPENKLARFNHQKTVKQAAFRTSWESKAHSFFFGVYTPVHTGHTHMDPLGFDYTAWEENLLADPGYFTYENNQERENFKSPQWHNTVIVNERYPFEYLHSFRYGEQKKGDILLAKEVDGDAIVIGYHDNYAPIRLTRCLLLLEEQDLLVLDLIEGRPQTVDIYYHWATEQVHLAEPVFGEWKKVQMQMAYSKGLTAELLSGSVSKETDRKEPSRRLHLQAKPVEEKSLYAVLCQASPKGTRREPVSVEVVAGSSGWQVKAQGEKIYTISWDGSTQLEIQKRERKGMALSELREN